MTWFRRTPGRKSHVGFVVVVASLVAIVFAAYYIHFRSQLDSAHRRNLRFLATMSTQVETTLQSYASVVTGLAEHHCEDRKIDRFLDEQTSMYIYQPPPPDAACPNNKSGSGRCFAIEQDLEQVPWLLLHAHGGPACPDKKPRGPVHAKANLSSEFEYFLPRDEYGPAFESVVIADAEGNVIYQPPHAQLHISNVKMLFSQRDASKSSTNRFDELRRTSSLTTVDVGGKEYDLYSQPVRLSSIKSEEWENVKGEWVLCGLAQPRDSYKQALRIPYPYLFSIVNIIALCFLALPWLRIRLLAKHERLRRWDVALAGISAFLGLAVALSLPVYYHTIRALRLDTEQRLGTVADRVQKFLLDDLRSISAYAQKANAKLLSPGSHLQTETLVLNEKIVDSSHKPVGNPGYVPGAYPFTDYVFWTGKNGKQLIKWSSFSDVSPFLDVTTEQFYLAFQGEILPRIKDAQGKLQEFFFSGQLAPTTGTYKAIVGFKEESPADDKPAAWFVVGQPRSLFRVVLPSGTAFCLVDKRTGETIFHSDYKHDRNENLFVETEDNPALKAAMSVGHGLVEVNYGGRRDLAYVTRISGIEASPLVLVVFADRLVYETEAALIAALAVLLHIVYALIVAIVLGTIWIFIRPVRIIELIWPRAASLWRYFAVAGIMLAHILIFVMWSSTADLPALGYGTLLTCLLAACMVLHVLSPKWEPRRVLLAVAGTGLVFTILCFRLSPSLSGPFAGAFVLTVAACVVIWYASRRVPAVCTDSRLLTVFTLALLLGIIGLSVAPAVALFRVASRYESTLFVQYGQQRLGESLRERQLNMYWLETPERFDPATLKLWHAVGDDTPGLYHPSFYRTMLTENGTETSGSNASALDCKFGDMLARLHSPFNSIAVRMHAVATVATDAVYPELCSQQSPWSIGDAPGQVAYRVRTLDGRFLRLQSAPPTTDLNHSPKLLLAMLVGCLIYFLGLRSGARRIFALDWRMPQHLAPHLLAKPVDQNYLALIRPCAADDLLAERNDLEWIDIAELESKGGLEQALESANSICGPVAIRNFDVKLDDVTLNEWKLKLVERLVIQRRKHVVLLSRIDPSFHFDTQSEIPESLRRRWRTVLAKFTRLDLQGVVKPDEAILRKDFFERTNPKLPMGLRHDLAGYLARECAVDSRLAAMAPTLPVPTFSSREEILTELERTAAAYYGYLWDTCSREEQILLHQIAKYRFANPLAVHSAFQLYRKGLITNDPTQWFMNRSFCRFVKALPEPEAMSPSPDEPPRDTFEQGAIVVLAAISLPLILGFAASQGESLQGVLSVVSAALATLGTITKLLAGRKAGSP